MSFFILSYEQHLCECLSIMDRREEYGYAEARARGGLGGALLIEVLLPTVRPLFMLANGQSHHKLPSHAAGISREIRWHQHVVSFAYLLILGGRCDDVVHQNGYQLSYSMHACSECSIRCRKAWSLPLGLGLVQPFPRYRVYDVECSQFVCAGCLFEVGEEFLNED